MKKFFLFYLLTIIATACVISCGDHKKSTTETKDNKMNFLRSRDIEKAMDELKNLDKSKGKKIMVFQNIYFYEEGRIILSVADINKPDSVDEYTYAEEKWLGPKPIKLSGDGKLSDNVVDLDQINYKAVPDMMKIVDAKVKEIGAKTEDIINYLKFEFNPTFDTKTFHITITKDDDTYSLTFDINGKLKEAKKVELNYKH